MFPVATHRCPTDPRADLVQFCETLRAAPDRHLVLQVDRRNPFGSTRQLIKVARELGIRHLVVPNGIHSVADDWFYRRE